MAKNTVEKIIKSVVKGDIKGATEEIKGSLARTIGLAGVVIISLSAMLPGIFVTPTFAAQIMGPGIWLAFLLAASVVLLERYLNLNFPQECQPVVVHTYS